MRKLDISSKRDPERSGTEEDRVITEASQKDWDDFWYNSEDIDLYRNHEEGC